MPTSFRPIPMDLLWVPRRCPVAAAASPRTSVMDVLNSKKFLLAATDSAPVPRSRPEATDLLRPRLVVGRFFFGGAASAAFALALCEVESCSYSRDSDLVTEIQLNEWGPTEGNRS